MTPAKWSAPFLLFLAILPAVPGEDGPAKPYGLKARVPWTTSRLVGTPEPPPPYRAVRAFPKLQFKGPVFLAEEPGTGRLLVAEVTGKIYAFPKDRPEPDALEVFLDSPRQIYAFSFHPQYEKNGQVFVFSPTDPKIERKKQNSRVSRFLARGSPRRCSLDTEKVIVEWPAGGHNGGEAIFGADGYLYISTGDGTSTSDENNTGQGVNDLQAVIMRIDVDRPDPGRAYSIPKDNPFVHFPGARPEVWAFGFRNPWRMSFDPRDGGLWVGDVGQDLWEMIWRVERGGNYGWSVQEGSHPFHPGKEAGPGPILPPVVEHHHTECRSITGGYVYQGDKFPELRGAYLYGDYEYGKVWGLRHAPRPAPEKKDAPAPTPGVEVTWHKELADTALRIASFGLDRDGEVYLLDHISGEVHRLERADAAKAPHPFPRKLSETGLFASTKEHKVAPGVIPYSVNTSQWLDGATAERFLALPAGAKLTAPRSDVDHWECDDGTVTAQTVSLALDMADPASRRRVETRVMVRQEGHWLGYSYLWDEGQADAELVEAAGRDVVFHIADPSAPGGRRRQTWRVPARNECMICHSRAAGFVLGLRTAQMNRDHDYGGAVDNQLRSFSHVGLFRQPLVGGRFPAAKPPAKGEKEPPPRTRPEDYTAFPDAHDEKADLDSRARAYLHVHCAVCHVGSGGGNARFEIHYDTPLDKAFLLNEVPLHGTFGLPDGRLIAPGDPYSSVLLYRVSKIGRGRMPHVGSRRTDERGVGLLHDWVLRLTPEGKVRAGGEAHPDYLAARETFAEAGRLPAGRRAEALGKLLASPREALVAARLAAKEPPGPVRDELIALGAAREDANVRDLFERFLPEERRTRTLGDVIRAEEILSLKGDAARGREYFLSATASQCRSCHRVHGEGGTLGPDLSEIAKTLKPHEILESLTAPSKKIDPKYQTHLLVTSAGKIYTGVVVEKTDKEVVLSVFREGKAVPVRIPAGQVEELLPQPTSLMPDGLLRDLTPQQAADLLAFLASLK